MYRFSTILFSLCLIITAQAHAFSFPKYRLQQLSKTSFYNNKTKTCYRWMGANEARSWINGKPTLTDIPFNDLLYRAGKSGLAIYCWTYPSASNAGGNLLAAIPETYGDFLVKIDFIDDAVIYNRVLDNYIRWGDIFIGKSPLKKGINSEIMYANYQDQGYVWFQEIMIREISVIKSYSFDTPEMRDFVTNDYNIFMNDELPIELMHFFANKCQANNKKGCHKYKDILTYSFLNLQNRWINNELPKGPIYTGKTRKSDPSPQSKND